MKLKKSLLINIGLAAVVTSLIFFFSQKGFLKRLELAGLDFSFRLRANPPANPHIIIVEITDSDISQIGQWPWDRRWHAATVHALTALGAKCIGFDFIFSEPSAEEGDALFQQVMGQTKNVYLPFAFQDSACDIKNALSPLKRFSSSAKGTGAVNACPDIDGTIRRIPLTFLSEKGLSPHIALKIAVDYSGLNVQAVKPRYMLLSNPREKVKIPLVEKDTMLINWSGEWKNTFMHYGILEILAACQDLSENRKASINLDDFKKSICLIAVTATGICDVKSVPLEPVYPGVGVIATAISNILNKDFIYTPPIWVNILILYILALIPPFLIFGEKPIRESLVVVLVGTVYFFVHVALFKRGVALGLSSPLIGLFASYLAVETYNFVRISIERQTFFKMSVTDGLTGLYNIRYFRMLLETEIKLVHVEPAKKFAIVMSDVDHFKHFNDTYGHQVGDLVLKEVANVLRTSVRAADIVARYGGEEMIILLRGGLLKDAMGIAEKIRKNVESRAVKDGHNTYTVTISLGVSTYKPEDDVESLIKRADDGLYKAKQSGRNRVCSTEEQNASP